MSTEISSLIPFPQQNVDWAASISGNVHLAVMGNSGLGKDLAERALWAEMPIPKSRFLT